MERSYIAFISYRHTQRDAAIAKEVHTLIENYVVPKALRKNGSRLGIVFRDEEELPVSSDLTESIQRALDVSRYLIVICSPQAKQSPWVAREIEYFLRNHSVNDVFVVLADGEPADVFPYALTHVGDASSGEFQEVEPLALDARADTIPEARRRLRRHIRKLYAAMLGCPYDHLVQREKARRAKRITALALLIVLLVGCFAAVLALMDRRLTQKNDELAEAAQAALFRETEMRAAEAADALEAGEMQAAIEGAAAALCPQDSVMVYHASAERTLFSALDVFGSGESGTLLTKTAIEHNAPVEMMACSADGNRVFLIDSYGAVCCYDAASGTAIWSAKPQETSSFSISSAPQLWYDAERGSLVCYYDSALTCLNAADGMVQWWLETPGRMAQGLIFDDNGQTCAFIEEKYVASDDWAALQYEYNLVCISAATGQVLNRIPLFGVEDAERVYFPTMVSDGTFAGEGRFVGTAFLVKDGVCKSVIYAADLARNSVMRIENETYAQESDRRDYLRIFAAGDDRVLVLSVCDGLQIRCFDVAQETLLWESHAGNAAAVIPLDAPCYAISCGTDCVIGAGRFMCVVDLTDGRIRASTGLMANIAGLYPIQMELFGFHLANGYCAVGWYNSHGLRDSSSWGASVDLPDSPLIIAHQPGLIQPKVSQNQIEGFDMAPRSDGGGSMVCLSEDRCTAYVVSMLPSPELPAFSQISWQGASPSFFGDYVDENPADGTVIMGTAYTAEKRGMAVISTAEHSAWLMPVDPQMMIADQIFLTKDSRSIVACMQAGDVWLIGSDGTVNVLSERENVALATVGDTTFVDARYDAESARQASDGKILTARCDGETIDIWLDGGDMSSIPVPENIRWCAGDLTRRSHLFHVGANGLMVLSHYPSEDVDAVEAFAVYDSLRGEWRMITDAAHGTAKRLMAFGQTSPVFAVYDTDMNIRVYHRDCDGPVHCLKAELPWKGVLEMGLFADDRFIYVIMQDGQVIIWSLATDSVVFRTGFSDISIVNDFVVKYDQQNSRIYIGVEQAWQCVDVRSWEPVFSFEDADGIVFYSLSQNELYRSRYQGQGCLLEFMDVPSTQELLDAANSIQW